MSEVRGSVVRAWLQAMGAHGHRALAEATSRKARARGVSLDQGFAPWSLVVWMLDELGRRSGGAERLLFEPAADATPYWAELGALAPASPEPAELYRLYAEVLGPSTFVPLSFRLERAGRALVIDVEAPPSMRGGTSLFFAHGATLAGLSVLTGAPRAHVRAMTSPRAARYVVTPDAAFAVRGSGALAGAARPEPPGGEAGLRLALLDVSREAARLEARQDELLALERLGRSFAALTDLHELAAAIVATLGRDFGWTRCQLWVIPDGSTRHALLGQAGGAPEAGDVERLLEHGGQGVGRLLLGRDRPLGPAQAGLFERLLPWVAMSLEGARRLSALRGQRLVVEGEGGRAAPPGPGREGWSRAARVAERAERWGLTPRQREVLAGLVRGLSSKQIAAELGCSPNTVEVHVGQVLRKSGASGRRALLVEVLGPSPRAARTPP